MAKKTLPKTMFKKILFVQIFKITIATLFFVKFISFFLKKLGF